MNPSNRTRRYYAGCLAIRCGVFAFLMMYALSNPTGFAAEAVSWGLSPLSMIWGLLMLTMLARLFPSKQESLGCQKEFAGRFRPTGQHPSRAEIHKADLGALRVLLCWLAANGIFFFAYHQGWLGVPFMVCLTGFYAACDVICILFFCPFQAWLMHNRCCTTCRIYNWDYLMMCTPLLAVPGPMATCACAVAALLFVRWELTYVRNRERFFESSNQALKCKQCQEQLCKYKRAIAAKNKGLF